MIRRVADFISRYNMFVPGQSLGVAVSGGADSVCLLHVLAELAPRWALRLTVLHLNHQLRGEASDADERFVRELARSLGLRAEVAPVNVAAQCAATGDNLEQAARRARREFYLGAIRSGVVARVATGHTRTDQAETVLLRLFRGAGLEGLAAMRPVTPEGLVRPLLAVSRPEAEGYLRQRGIAWREDESNRDRRFARNRLRHYVMPVLAREFNPQLEEALARTAALAGEAEDSWRAEIERVTPALLVARPPGVLIRAGGLAGLARPVARRLVRRAIEAVRGDLRRIEFAHVESVLRLAGQSEGRGGVRLPGVQVTRSFDWLRLAPAAEEPAPEYAAPLTVPGEVELPGGVRVAARLHAGEGRAGGLDWEAVPKPLEVRSWRPGDRYQPEGQAGAVKLKDLFQKHRIPAWDRAGWPVVVAGGAIVWSRRFGPAAAFAARPGAAVVLEFESAEQLAGCLDHGAQIWRLNE